MSLVSFYLMLFKYILWKLYAIVFSEFASHSICSYLVWRKDRQKNYVPQERDQSEQSGWTKLKEELEHYGTKNLWLNEMTKYRWSWCLVMGAIDYAFELMVNMKLYVDYVNDQQWKLYSK